MNQLEKLSPINRNQLSQGQYFQSIFLEICNRKLLKGTQIEKIQLELVELMGKVVDRYTSGESSSVPVEKAQELLQSVTYSIGVYLKTIDDMDEVLNLLKNEKISILFNRGMEAVFERKEKAEVLLKEIQKNLLQVNNYAYHDTIMEGIPVFFHDYNIEFAAQDMPGSIDYPLLETITDLSGVEFSYEYLRRLTIENNFLCRFSNENINMLLNGFDKESEHMLINLFELVWNNVIGCELLGLNLCKLDISSGDLSVLHNKLINLNRDELKLKMDKAMEEAGKELCLEEDIMNYSKRAIPQLVSRVYHNLKTGTLKEIFISFNNNVPEEEPFIDGEPMEDEKLRELMGEISNLPKLSEKITRIREAVHSLYDLTELLDECFYGNECIKVLELLNDAERTVLRHRILEEAGVVSPKDYKTDKQWQKILFNKNN